MVLVLSHTGNEKEIVWALEKLKRIHKACKVLYVGATDGEASQCADLKVVLPDALESGLIATRTSSALLLVTMVVCAWLSGKDIFLKEIVKLPKLIDFNRVQDEIKQISLPRPLPIHVTFLGSGPYLGAACEGSLKLREMAAIGSEYQNTLEFCNGCHSWLTNQTLVVSLLSNTFKAAELQATYQLGLTRAPRALFAESLDDDSKIRVDFSVELRAGVSEISRVLLLFPLLHLLAFYMALAKGKNPDKPKHLERSIELKERPGV